MAYTQVRIKQEYRQRLARLASVHNRSMANMVEVLIDEALRKVEEPPKEGSHE